MPGGSKLWRLKYRYADKEKRLALGAYPAVPLQKARQRRTEAREQLANGIDPGEQKKADKQAQKTTGQTFETLARSGSPTTRHAGQRAPHAKPSCTWITT